MVVPWYIRHKKERNAYCRAWRRTHVELQAALNRAWYVRHGKEHYNKNKIKHHKINQNCYAKRVGLTRSQIMARIKSVSMVEVAGRSLAVARAGCALRHQPREIFGKPDYANKKNKVAVFIHGCWFHACPKHRKIPKTNTTFWKHKFKRNVQRHREVSALLKQQGWRIIVIWEHEVRAWQKGLASR